jgi:tRNA pseudouridine55 synthase
LTHANALNGWLIVDKPVGIGSTQVVGAVKRVLREGGYAPTKKDMPKVGHGGTLDPLASGVLPIALGEATKLAGRMLDATKTYWFTIAFGTQTDTLDREGKVIATSEVRPTQAAIQEALKGFRGTISQTPPAFSALKIDGQRAYDLARAGDDPVMTPRQVTIHELVMSHWDLGWDDTIFESLSLSATVSKGTYIRSLARDIALACGTVGHVSLLRRDRAGPFGLESAISLDILGNAAKARDLEAYLLPLEAGLDGIPALSLAPGEAEIIRHGGTLSGQSVDDGTYLALDGSVPVALVSVQAGQLVVVRGFNL